MAEFKILEGYDGEIAALQSAGNQIAVNGVTAEASGLSLPTSTLYIEQHQRIWSLLNLYQAMVLKDAADLTEMVKEARMLDQGLAGG